jgi:hypothetical protein
VALPPAPCRIPFCFSDHPVSLSPFELAYAWLRGRSPLAECGEKALQPIHYIKYMVSDFWIEQNYSKTKLARGDQISNVRDQVIKNKKGRDKMVTKGKIQFIRTIIYRAFS